MNDLSALARLDAMAQAELCAAGEVTSRELWEECMARIAALNPLLRAVVALRTTAPEPTTIGPFAGVPFLIKDASPWPGLRWSLGSRLFANRIAQQQTPYGRRLADAGLVCVGKTALSEFGLLASTESLLDGATLNPYQLAASPMGSSGGSAVAVAAGLVPLAHANDGGGSIRAPASACGVFGFKPSRGRTVIANPSASDFAEMTSEHCISRSVRDSALFLSVTEDLTVSQPIGFVREPIARPLRIAAWTRTLAGAEPDPLLQRAHEDAVGLLIELGHRVEQITPPSFDALGLAEACYLVAGVAVAGMVESMDRLRREPVQRGELEPFTWALVEAAEARGADALPSARSVMAQAAASYRHATRAFDVVLTPTLGIEPPPVGYLSPILVRDVLLERTARVLAYTPVHNIAGVPAMSVPLYWSESGLPIGAHFAAAAGQDALLLGLAYQLEQARPWHQRWPPFSIPALSAAE